MTAKNINVERLIKLVKNRPAIWDKYLETYKNKKVRIAAWREICAMLNDGFEEMEDRKRQDYAKAVVKRWTNIRDSWLRSLNGLKKRTTSGASAVSSRNYVYHHQLQFLKKIVTPAPIHDSASDNESDSAEDGNQSEVKRESTVDENLEENTEKCFERSKINNPLMLNMNDVDKKMRKFLDLTMKNQIDPEKQKGIAEDRNLLFFKSLLPSLATLNDDLLLEFQSGVLNLLQNIKARNQCSPAGHSFTMMQNHTSTSQGHASQIYVCSTVPSSPNSSES